MVAVVVLWVRECRAHTRPRARLHASTPPSVERAAAFEQPHSHLDLLAAAATPWVQPPSGSAEVKMAALDDHEVRVEAWVTKRTQLGLSAKCYAICIASQCTPGVGGAV